jgi:hypothetical protein
MREREGCSFTPRITAPARGNKAAADDGSGGGGGGGGGGRRRASAVFDRLTRARKPPTTTATSESEMYQECTFKPALDVSVPSAERFAFTCGCAVLH